MSRDTNEKAGANFFSAEAGIRHGMESTEDKVSR